MESNFAAFQPSRLAAGDKSAMPSMDPIVTSDKSTHGHNSTILRSASCDQISIGRTEPRKIKRTLSENALPSPHGGVSRRPSLQQKLLDKGRGLSKYSSVRSDVKPSITISKYTLATQCDHSSTASSETGNTSNAVPLDRKSRSVSGSLSIFARKSWSTASRSPSPRKRPAPAEGATFISPVRDLAVPLSPTPKNNLVQLGKKPSNVGPVDPVMKSSVASKKPRRPLSAFLGRASSEQKVPMVPLIPKSFSLERLPSLTHAHSSNVMPNVPKSNYPDRLQNLGLEPLRKKDELWGAFRALDGDFNK